MPSVHLIHPDGRRTRINARAGRSLMQAAQDARVSEIVAECGGSLICATCHVYVAPDWADRLPAVSADEDAMLTMTAAERRPTSRLSCQIVIDTTLDGLVVELPHRQY
ncbi:MAG TPA: 2Fe-2S iron-sulfur cluster-binding protein [Rubrivivax sp.]